MKKKIWVKVIALLLAQGIFIGNAAAGEIGQTLIIYGKADFLAPQLMIDNIQIQQACIDATLAKKDPVDRIEFFPKQKADSWFARFKIFFKPQQTPDAKEKSKKPKARNWNAETEDILRALEQSRKSNETTEKLLRELAKVITETDFNPEQLSFETLKKICESEILTPELNRKIEDLLLKKNLNFVIRQTFRKKTAEYFFKKIEGLLQRSVDLSNAGLSSYRITAVDGEIFQKALEYLSPAQLLFLWDKFRQEEPVSGGTLQKIINDIHHALEGKIHDLAEDKWVDTDLGDFLSEEERTILTQEEKSFFDKAASKAEAQEKSKYTQARDVLQRYKDSQKSRVSEGFRVYCLVYEIIHQFSESDKYSYHSLLQEAEPVLTDFEKNFIEAQLSSILIAIAESGISAEEFAGMLRRLDIVLRISRVELPRLRKQMENKKDKDSAGQIILTRGYSEEFEINTALLKPEKHSIINVLIPAIRWITDNAAKIIKFYPRDRETAIEALCNCLHHPSNSNVRAEAMMTLSALRTDWKVLFNLYTGLFVKSGVNTAVLREGLKYLRDCLAKIAASEEMRNQVIKSLSYLLRHIDNTVRQEARGLLTDLGVDTSGLFTIYTGLVAQSVNTSIALKQAIEFLQDNAGEVPSGARDAAYDAVLTLSQTSSVERNHPMMLIVQSALERLRPASTPLQNALFAPAVTAIEQAI
ncbi:MAG: hypothetical protein KKD05_02105 [Candidatus Omnitrophica bacterium]|nr:hypothetical protein [Candidatus Omnitrophota bacterium]